MSVCYDHTMTEVDSIKYKKVVIIHEPVETCDKSGGMEPAAVDSSVGSCGTFESTMARMDSVKRVSFAYPQRS